MRALEAADWARENARFAWGKRGAAASALRSLDARGNGGSADVFRVRVRRRVQESLRTSTTRRRASGSTSCRRSSSACSGSSTAAMTRQVEDEGALSVEQGRELGR